MVNREVIRIKALQQAYAYYMNGGKNIDVAERELLFSLSKTYDLYNYLLALIVALTGWARKQAERGAAAGDEEANARFLNNQFEMQLETNRELNDFIESHGDIWTESHAEVLRSLYRQLSASELFRDYRESADDSYDDDREFWRKAYRTFIEGNDDIDAALEDECIFWNDERPIVDTFVVKTIKRFDPHAHTRQQLLPEYDSDEELDFARRLFRAAILNADEYKTYMEEAVRNWDLNRLAFMDVLVLQLAIAEMLTFPSIPVSVTINEYVDLAKSYSTPKSGKFVNGMLDTIARHLIATGRLLKKMDNARADDTPAETPADNDDTPRKEETPAEGGDSKEESENQQQ